LVIDCVPIKVQGGYLMEERGKEKKQLQTVIKRFWAWLISAKHDYRNLPFEKRLFLSSNAIYRSPKEKQVPSNKAAFKKMKVYRGKSV
jgi:hypothetical protein